MVERIDLRNGSNPKIKSRTIMYSLVPFEIVVLIDFPNGILAVVEQELSGRTPAIPRPTCCFRVGGGRRVRNQNDSRVQCGKIRARKAWEQEGITR